MHNQYAKVLCILLLSLWLVACNNDGGNNNVACDPSGDVSCDIDSNPQDNDDQDTHDSSPDARDANDEDQHDPSGDARDDEDQHDPSDDARDEGPHDQSGDARDDDQSNDNNPLDCSASGSNADSDSSSCSSSVERTFTKLRTINSLYEIVSVAFDGEQLISVDSTGDIRVWDIDSTSDTPRSQYDLGQWLDTDEWVDTLVAANHGFLALTLYESVYFVQDSEEPVLLESSEGTAFVDIAISPDKNRIVAIGYDDDLLAKIDIWDWSEDSNGYQYTMGLQLPDEHSGDTLTSVAYSPDGARFAVASYSTDEYDTFSSATLWIWPGDILNDSTEPSMLLIGDNSADHELYDPDIQIAFNSDGRLASMVVFVEGNSNVYPKLDIWSGLSLSVEPVGTTVPIPETSFSVSDESTLLIDFAQDILVVSDGSKVYLRHVDQQNQVVFVQRLSNEPSSVIWDIALSLDGTYLVIGTDGTAESIVDDILCTPSTDDDDCALHIWTLDQMPQE